jgi:large subunit ribosomal protein L13
MNTVVVNSKSIKHDWYIVDAAGMTVGRLASKASKVLSGKGKPAFSPNQDHGDYLIIINSDKIKLSGKKPLTKFYFSHSNHPGGAKFRSFKNQMNSDSTQVIIHAIHGMISKNALGRKVLGKLHVYAGASHPHAAQKPRELTF